MVNRKLICKQCKYEAQDFREAKDHYIYNHLVIFEQFVIKGGKD